MAAAIPLVFGAIGAWAAPAGYASLGFSIGSAIGSMLVPQPDMQGPRLSDLNVQASTYGQAVTKVYGRARVAGNLIWTSGIREVASEEGGKGGPSYTSYSYFSSWAVSLCAGPVVGVTRIWFDSDLVYDITDEASAATVQASGEFANKMTIHLGSESQTADPLMEAHEGAGNVPAYRGTAYLVFDDLNIDKYGRIPNVSVEIGEGYLYTNYDLTLLNWDVAHFSTSTERIFNVLFDPSWSTLRVAYYTGTNVDSYVKLRTFQVDGDTLTLLSTSGGSGDAGSRYYNGHYMGIPYSNASSDVYSAFQPYASPTYFRLKTINGDEDYYIGGMTASYGGPYYYLASGRVAVNDDWLAIYAAPYNSGGATVNYRIYLFQRGVTGAYLKYINVASIVSGHAMGSMAFTEDGQKLIVGVMATVSFHSIDLATSAITLISDSTSLSSYPGCQFSPIDETTGYIMVSSSARMYDLSIPSLGATNLGSLPNSGTNATNATQLLTVGARRFVLFYMGGRDLTYHTAGIYGDIEYEADSKNTYAYVDAMVSGIASEVGASIDVTALAADTVNGYAIGRQMTARAALKPLQDAYLFDIVEDGGALVCVKRGGDSVASVADDDLAASEPGQNAESFSIRRGQDAELPRKLNVHYHDVSRDHQVNVQSASRLATEAVSEVDMEIPIVTDADHMAQVAEVLLYNAWRGRETVSFSIPAETYYTLAPADIVTVTYAGEAHRLRLTKLDYSIPGVIRCEAAFDDAALYSSSATGVSGSVSVQTVSALGASVGAWMDTPLLLDSHDPAGVYVAFGSDGGLWQGGALLLSVDGGVEYATAATFPVQCVVGTTSTTLASGTVDRFDRASTVRVVLSNPANELSSITEAQAMDGGNACYIGGELLNFTTATLVTAGTYDLSGFLRGRRGTEWAVGSHTASDRFVLLNSAVRRATVPNAKIGATVHYKFVQTGEIAGDIAGTAVTYAARAYEPYAVCHLTATDAGGGDWDIAWTRRNRLDGEWRDYVDVPMSEATEAYRVEVYAGSTLQSSADVTTTTATVAASSGDTVKVYQLSATSGPGFVSTVSIP